MRVSEAIARLKQIEAQYGDLHIATCQSPGVPAATVYFGATFEVIRAERDEEEVLSWVIGNRSEDILVCY